MTQEVVVCDHASLKHICRICALEAKVERLEQAAETRARASRRVIMTALETAHTAGALGKNWEGSLNASARIVRELGLEER